MKLSPDRIDHTVYDIALLGIRLSNFQKTASGHTMQASRPGLSGRGQLQRGFTSSFSLSLAGCHDKRRPQFRRRQPVTCHYKEEQEPNWEEEMSIFKRRTLKPSQLEALRKLEEEKVDVGRVLYCKDSIAIVEGLNNDADVGTLLSFSSGAVGTLLWRRSDNVVFALLLGGSDLVTIGDGVECKVRAILQVVDESAGPSTKKEYHLTTVPVGEALRGQVVDYLGRPLSPDGKLHNGTPQANTHQLGTESRLPLINRQPDMESREQITEALVTGVKALDILTPLGRGQALQVSGPKGSGKTQLCLDAILGQQGAGVCCFYAAVGCTGDQLSRTVAQLEEHKAMGYTTVVAAPSDRSLGEQYAAMLTACSMAEAVRDAGGHALVVLNDVSVAVRMWEMITVAMADLGSVALDVLQTGSNANASGERQDGEDDAMVEYEGMLVSVAAAQRRRFFSSMIQRCAKMHRRLKGGSLTGLFVVPGCPAGSGDLTGELSSKRLEAMKQKVRTYRHLTEEQKDKLLHALEKPASTSARASDTSQDVATEHQIFSLSDIRASQELRTEIVEEFMSIVDGQIVLKRPSEVGMDLKDKDKSKPHAGVLVDPRASLSRIGSRAHPPALVDLAPTIRFDLLQAEDARRFAAAAAMQLEGRHTKTLHRADIVKAALQQPIRSPCPLEIQVVHLMAIKCGLLDDCEPSQVGERLDRITSMIQNSSLQSVLAEIAETKRLTATSQAALEGGLAELRTC